MNCKCKDKVEVSFFSEMRDDEVTPIQDMRYSTYNDACVDIRCSKEVTLLPNEYQMIPTGLFVAIPDGYEMQVRPRSGISAKTSLIFKNTIGTVDAGYRDELFVVWYNLGVEAVTFNKYDRIAQVKIEEVLPVEYSMVGTLKELKSIGTNRGGGFGHTGLD